MALQAPISSGLSRATSIQRMKNIVDYGLGIGQAATCVTYGDLMTKLNLVATALALPTFNPANDNAGVIRGKINAIGTALGLDGDLDLAYDAALARYWSAGGPLTPASQITDTHAQSILVPDGSGGWVSRATNVLCDGLLGLQTVPTRTNLFLNSSVPVTQVITVVNGTTYAVSVHGSGSVTLTGAGTGVASAGSPVIFVASTTSLTVTVAGSLSYAQVEAGAYATAPIVTAGTSVARTANIPVIPGLNFASVSTNGIAGFVKLRYMEDISAATTQRLLQFDDGTETNRFGITRSGTQLVFSATTASASIVSMNIGAISLFINTDITIAFILTPTYARARIVQNVTDPAAVVPSATLPVVTGFGFGGPSYGTVRKTYQLAKKLSLKYGAFADPAATYANMVALALAA